MILSYDEEICFLPSLPYPLWYKKSIASLLSVQMLMSFVIISGGVNPLHSMHGEDVKVEQCDSYGARY